jgi:hypothetical protein
MEMVKCSCLNRVTQSKRTSNPLSNAMDEDWRFERESCGAQDLDLGVYFS